MSLRLACELSIVLTCLTASAAATRAQAPAAISTSPAGQAAPAGPADAAVVARVNGVDIPFREVKQQIAGTLQGRAIPNDALPLVYAQALEQVIGRHLIAAEMKNRKLEPTEEELKQAAENFDKNLARRGITREEYLKQNYLAEADLEKVRYWEICWNRFSRELLTDADLEKFFQAHRRDFDGTEVRVSHILLRVEGHQDQATVAAAVKKAQGIRDEITAKTISFADAAKKYSAGPSREQAGDLGFVPRRERMVEEFSAAAFRLQPGEISPPVVSPFGVHLITVTDEKPGKIPWQDVKESLIAAAQPSLFRQLVVQMRPTAQVEYTGAIPHYDPATGRIAPAK